LRGIHEDRRSPHVAYDASIGPSLQTLEIESNHGLRTFRLPTFPTSGASVLTILILKDTTFDPSLLEYKIHSPWSRNLTTLQVVGVKEDHRSGGHAYYSIPYDYKLLTQAMLGHLPHLQKFTWTSATGQDGRIPFGSWAGFAKLEELSLDYHFFVGAQDDTYASFQNFLSLLRASFPPILKLIELGNLSWHFVWSRFRLMASLDHPAAYPGAS
jgi:hypothetical protein